VERGRPLRLRLEILPGDDILAIIDLYHKKGSLFVEISPPHKKRFKIHRCSWHKLPPCAACLGWLHYNWLPTPLEGSHTPEIVGAEYNEI